ncbi:hypothetical protein [Rhodopirellula baltica]
MVKSLPLQMLVVIYCTCWLVSSEARCQTPREVLDSYFSAARTNFEAIEKFDLFIRTDITKESQFQTPEVVTTFQRIVFDSDSERYLFASRGQRISMTSEKVDSFREGFVLNEHTVRRLGARGNSVVKETGVKREEVFDQLHLPDVRIMLFPSLDSRRGRLWQDNSFESYTLFAKQASEVKFTSADAMSFRMMFENGIGYSFRFDPNTLLPSYSKWFSVAGDDTNVLAEGDFRWEQNSGIFVPILASFEHNRPELPLAMKGLPREELAKQIRIFKTKTNVQLHWISINQEIDPKLTSLSMLDSVSDFFQLTDPLEQGLPVLDTFQTPGDVSEK